MAAKHQLKNYPICWQIEASGSGRGKKRQIDSRDYITQTELCNLNELERAQQSQTGSDPTPRLEKHLGGQKGIESSILKYQEQQGMNESGREHVGPRVET